jgi:hypothetical protein
MLNMTQAELDAIKVASRERQDALLEAKGKDYTRHDPDRLANFKRAANDTGIETIKAWYIYATKHWDAISAFVKTGKTESEEIVGRFDDLHNYLILGEAIIGEETYLADVNEGDWCSNAHK